MLLATVLLAAGAALLALGAAGAVRAAGRLALSTGIPVFALGALLFGIDLEGLGTALLAAGRGETTLAAGGALGTVLFVGSVAFGLALIASPGPVPSPGLRMVIAPSLPLAAAGLALFDDSVDRLEGLVLLGMYAGYLTFVVTEGRAVRDRAGEIEREAAAMGGGRLRTAEAAAASLAVVWAGAWLLVGGGTRILDRTGLAAGFVGAAVIATLAGLDEILLEVLPVRRGEPHLATGNLMGTVAAFPSAVLGAAALVRPLDTDGAANLAFILGVAIYAVTASVFILRGRAGKLLGVALLAMAPAYLAVASRA